jgi:hypothetical protein
VGNVNVGVGNQQLAYANEWNGGNGAFGYGDPPPEPFFYPPQSSSIFHTTTPSSSVSLLLNTSFE